MMLFSVVEDYNGISEENTICGTVLLWFHLFEFCIRMEILLYILLIILHIIWSRIKNYICWIKFVNVIVNLLVLKYRFAMISALISIIFHFV